MLVERKTLGRTQQIMLRDDVWGKLGRFLRLHWDIGFVMSDMCGEKCQDLRPKKSCFFLSGHHIFQDWNVMKIIQVLRVAVPRRSCLSSSCQGSHENSRFEVFRPLNCGQVLPCLPLRQLWGCRNGKWALGEWSINHTVLAWICRARCMYLSGLFKFKGNPNPPGDCGLDSCREVGENEMAPETATLASECFFWGYSAARGGRFGESFLVSFLFPHVNQAESAKEFELHNLARNIPQLSRECGLNGLPWQTRVGRIRD